MGGSDCELLREGFFAQPVNTWSSLAFVAAGLVVLRRRFVLVSGGRSLERPPLTRTRVGEWSTVAGGVALVLVGVGSVAYHGPQPGWGKFAHDGSIVLLLGVLTLRFRVAFPPLRGRQREPEREVGLRWGLAAGAFVAGIAAWVVGRTGSALCSPSSWFQWHAVWHVLSAVAAAAVLVPRAAAAQRLASSASTSVAGARQA